MHDTIEASHFVEGGSRLSFDSI